MQTLDGLAWQNRTLLSYGASACTAVNIGAWGLQGLASFPEKSSGPEVGHPPGEATVWALEPGGIGAWIRGVGTAGAGIAATGDLVAEITGEAVLNADGWTGVQRTALLAGVGGMDAPLVGVGELTCEIQIGSRPSAEDIFYAVLDTKDTVETGVTLRQALRVLLAVAAGKTTITAGTPVVVKFRNTADTKDRVTAEMDGSERDKVTLDVE